MILVPAFTYILKLSEKEARATSIFCILPMVCASSVFYLKSSYIDFKLSILCAIRRSYSDGFFGAKIMQKLSDKYLKIFFTIFLIYVGIKLILGA
ncbi:MAG: sulfite exporter TauE/SafE family protein [Clostridia bacterium]|jgi:uncharacterized membrane protein YfcA|nr:sulfite exporter TauE/SafE family protein [Clostridia bacterium]